MNSSVSECIDVQTIPQFDSDGNYVVNPDVGGVAIAFSNIIINTTLPILLCWSNSGIQTTILILLSQVYPILIATAASIGTNNLSLYDVHFAIAVTASPLSYYYAYSSFRDLIGRPNTLFSKLGVGKEVIRFLGLLLPLFWLSVNLITFFDHQAFRGSHSYVMGRRDLWDDLAERGGLGTISIAAMWIWAVYLVRHRWDIYEEVAYWKQHQRGRGFFTRLFLFVYNVPAASWHVITKSHPWTIFVIVLCLHWSWVLGIAKGMVFEQYQFSYGQIASLFTTLPPLFSVGQVLVSRWAEFSAFSLDLPRAFMTELKFLIKGAPNPWKEHSVQHILFNLPLPLQLPGLWIAGRTSVSAPRAINLGWAVCCIWVIITALDIAWIKAYVKAGSIPIPRNLINKHHAAWKPFSISIYVYGYCVSCINILVWTTYYAKPRHSLETPQTDINRSIVWKAKIAKLVRSFNVLLLPVAFAMCVGPFFSPFAALPLAQQHQWTHYCDSFEGEAILIGTGTSPSASFYFPSKVDGGPLQLNFSFSLSDNDVFSQTLTGQGLSGPISNITQVSYNMTEQTFNIGCTNDGLANSTSAGTFCGYGNYSTAPYLNFSIRSINPDTTIRLQAEDEEWKFSDDAPSLALRYLNAGGSMGLGDTVLQTAVTKRNHCEVLKVCLASRIPDLAMLVPMGVILRAQSTYAQGCMQPKIYIM